MNNSTVASAFAKHYKLPTRAFGLPKSKIGSNEWLFRRLVTNIIVGGTLEENALTASEEIFEYYKDCVILSKAKHSKLTVLLQQNLVRFAERKAAYIINASTDIVKLHNGIVPNNRKDLEALPGVGRHVASIVLALGFNEPALAVDLHVRRIAKRLGLVGEKDSDLVIERTLKKGIDPENYGKYSRAFVDFGKEYCGHDTNCSKCFMNAKCSKKETPKTVARVTARAVKVADGVYQIVAGSSAVPYQVIVNNGNASCNCKGFRFRRTCSHVAEIVK